ncbi:MAG: class I SAM-dependent methyltransferase [Anaerolineae bacterium]|nr:class I SAM-dependent methyltransferase [Anaerolineae bacterium]
MPENESFWDFYWETRLLSMENLGKRAAILAASRLIRRLSAQNGRPLRLLELGCGEGQVIGALLEAHARVCAESASVGIDYNAQSLARCRSDYPALKVIQGDFTDPLLLNPLGEFDLVLLVNALHEVFSDCFSASLGHIDVTVGKQKVEQALAAATACLAPGGWLVLFDGLEPDGDPELKVHPRFHNMQARREFDTFALEYTPFNIVYRETANPLVLELSQHDFTRYITKSIFLGKQLWQSERRQSYQYFTTQEFRAAINRSGLFIDVLSTLTVNEEKWNYRVTLEDPAEHFPDEHILILAQTK